LVGCLKSHRIPQRQAQNDCQDFRSGENRRNRLLQHCFDDADEGDYVDQRRSEIREKPAGMGLIIVRKDRLGQD